MTAPPGFPSFPHPPLVPEPPLRILCLSNMYPGPGDPDYGAFVARMCDALDARGHDVRRVAIDTRARGPLTTPRKYAALARQALPEAADVDVIYAHYLFPTGAVAAICGGRRRVPWVVTAHGQDVRNLSRSTVRRLSLPGIRGAAAIIAVSRYLEKELRDTGIDLPDVHVINMGVDLARFQATDAAAARARLGVTGDPVILAVGGLTERKNPLHLLQAFRRIRSRFPDAQLVFVGDGPLRPAVAAGADRLGVGEAVTLTGALPHDAVADWMAACNVLALPSLVEPLGVVALEALASGRAVAATEVGGAREVVGEGGTLVDPHDPHSIADGIVELLTNPRSPARCRAVAAEHSVDLQAAKVEAILRSAAIAGR